MNSEILEDNNILVSIKCTSNIKVNLNVTGANSGKDYNLSENQIDCTTQMSAHEIKILESFFDEGELVVTTNIDKTANICHTCELSSDLVIINLGQTPDNTNFLIIILVAAVIIVGVFMNILFSSGEEIG